MFNNKVWRHNKGKEQGPVRLEHRHLIIKVSGKIEAVVKGKKDEQDRHETQEFDTDKK